MHCVGRAGPERRAWWRGQEHGAAGEAGQMQAPDETWNKRWISNNTKFLNVEHMRRVCKSDIVSLTHAATCGDKHFCCYEDSSPEHSSESGAPQTLSKWALSALSTENKEINFYKLT